MPGSNTAPGSTNQTTESINNLIQSAISASIPEDAASKTRLNTGEQAVVTQLTAGMATLANLLIENQNRLAADQQKWFSEQNKNMLQTMERFASGMEGFIGRLDALLQTPVVTTATTPSTGVTVTSIPPHTLANRITTSQLTTIIPTTPVSAPVSFPSATITTSTYTVSSTTSAGYTSPVIPWQLLYQTPSNTYTPVSNSTIINPIIRNPLHDHVPIA